MYQTIAIQEKDKIGTITLSREERRNAISPTMTIELLDALSKYDDDENILVMILTGAGSKAFCAGADFGESMGATSSFLDRHEGQRRFAQIFKVIKDSEGYIRSIDKPNRTALKLIDRFFDNVNEILGVFSGKAYGKISDVLTEGLLKLIIELRNKAREAKDWKTADSIRDHLQSIGIELQDTPDGTEWDYIQ